jgi:hypothetical protein
MKAGFQACLLIVVLLFPFCRAADSASLPSPAPDKNIAKILDHFRQTAAAGYQYQEVRALELVDAPWHGAGLLFSGADGTLIKLQLSPERIIMAITASRMYYYHAAQGQRYSAPLDFTAPMLAQIGTFRAILQGRADELYANYAVAVEQHGSRWKLHLAGKTPDNAGLKLEVSGDDVKAQCKLLMQQADDEKTEYVIEPATARQLTGLSQARLLAEAAGE